MGIGRWFRGALGLAVTWGLAFGLLALTFVAGLVVAGDIPVFAIPRAELFGIVRGAFLWGMSAGVLAGVLFATILSVAERTRTLASLSGKRVVMWGFIGGATIPLAMVAAFGTPWRMHADVVMSLGSVCFGLLSAAMARVTIGAARRAPQVASGTDQISRR